MPSASRSLGLGLLLLVAVVIAGCRFVPQQDREALCRALVPLFTPTGMRSEIRAVGALDSGHTIRIVTRVVPASGERAEAATSPGAPLAAARASRTLACSFLPGGFGRGHHATLTAVVDDGQRLGPVRLHLLRTRALARADLDAVPAPLPDGAARPDDAAPLLDIPRPAAIALQHFVGGLPSIAFYGLLATAFALVYGLIGRIHLAFGACVGLGGYAGLIGLAATETPTLWMALASALVLTISASAFHGVAGARLVLSPLTRPGPGRHAIVATLGLAIALEEYLRLLQGSRPAWVSPLSVGTIELVRAGDMIVTVTLAALIVSAALLALAVVLVSLLGPTRFGRSWRACAQDPVAAGLLGISPAHTLLMSVTIATVIAGLCGLSLILLYGGIGLSAGLTIGLKGLIGAVLGGIGSVPGAFIGGMLIGTFDMVWATVLPIAFRELAGFIVLAAVIVWRPHGLFGANHGQMRR